MFLATLQYWQQDVNTGKNSSKWKRGLLENSNLLVVAAAVVGVVLNMLARNILAEIVVAMDVRIELVLEYDWKKNKENIISKNQACTFFGV